MPRYNQVTGQIAAGIGGVEPGKWEGGAKVSIDRKVVAEPAGGADWYKDTHAIYHKKVAQPDTWELFAHNGQAEVRLAKGGATRVFGGGGTWARQSGGGPIESNTHPEMKNAGLMAIGPDGTMAFRPSHEPGLGLNLRNTSGVVTALVPPNVAVFDVQLHGGTAATYIVKGRIKSSYGDPACPDGACGSPRVVVHNGQRLLLYFHRDARGERLLLQTEWSRPVGYVLLEAGPNALRAHRPDITAAGGLKVCYSLTEAEGPSSIQEIAIDLSKPMVDLRRQSVPVPVPTPPPIVPPTPEPTVPEVVPDHSAYFARRCGELGLGRVGEGANDATRERTFTILNQIASELHAIDDGFGLLEKTSGNRWRDRSIDILTYLHASGLCDHLDVISDAEGADGDPRPSWSNIGPINAARWREPYPVSTQPPVEPPPVEPPPVTPPPVTPPTPPSDALLKAIGELRAELAEIRVDIADVREAQKTVDPAIAQEIANARDAVLAKVNAERAIEIEARYLGKLHGVVKGPK